MERLRAWDILKGIVCSGISILLSDSMAFSQDACSPRQNNSIWVLEQSKKYAESLHKGCNAREEFAFDRDPEAYNRSYGSNFWTCSPPFLAWPNCNDTAARLCSARASLQSAIALCRGSLNEENDLAESIADELNRQRRDDGGANTLSKGLTKGALDTLNSINGGALNDFTDAAKAANAPETGLRSGQVVTGSPGSSEEFAFDPSIGLELNPELQAILDLSVEELRRETQENKLSVESAQRILNEGLRQIEDENRRLIEEAGNDIFGGQSGSASEAELEARMKTMLRGISSKTQSGNAGITQANSIPYLRQCRAECEKQNAGSAWTKSCIAACSTEPCGWWECSDFR